MSYPADYAFQVRKEWGAPGETTTYKLRDLIAALGEAGYVVTRTCEPFGGQVAKVKVEAFGESASEVERTLREYGTRCDAASQSHECSWGEMVIERNLLEADGEIYSWKGRLTLHPVIGRQPAASRQDVL